MKNIKNTITVSLSICEISSFITHDPILRLYKTCAK